MSDTPSLLARAGTLLCLLALASCDRAVEPPEPPDGGRRMAVPSTSGPAGAPAPTWRPGTGQRLADPLPVQNPYSGDPQAIADGQRLWNWYNCAGCHSAGGGGGMGPSLIDGQWTYGGDDARVFESIWNGRQAGMPAWEGLLPQDDVWKIIAFIREAPRQSEWPWNEGDMRRRGTDDPERRETPRQQGGIR